MFKFQEKKRIRNILYSKITLFAIFVILIFLVKATFGVYYKNKVSGENLSKAKEEIAELEKREKALNSKIERIRTDKGTEEEIRKKFMVGKVGEQVIVIVDENKINKNGKAESDEKEGIWSKFLNIFR